MLRVLAVACLTRACEDDGVCLLQFLAREGAAELLMEDVRFTADLVLANPLDHARALCPDETARCEHDATCLSLANNAKKYHGAASRDARIFAERFRSDPHVQEIRACLHRGGSESARPERSWTPSASAAPSASASAAHPEPALPSLRDQALSSGGDYTWREEAQVEHDMYDRHRVQHRSADSVDAVTPSSAASPTSSPAAAVPSGPPDAARAKAALLCPKEVDACQSEAGETGCAALLDRMPAFHGRPATEEARQFVAAFNANPLIHAIQACLKEARESYRARGGTASGADHTASSAAGLAEESSGSSGRSASAGLGDDGGSTGGGSGGSAGGESAAGDPCAGQPCGAPCGSGTCDREGGCKLGASPHCGPAESAPACTVHERKGATEMVIQDCDDTVLQPGAKLCLAGQTVAVKSSYALLHDGTLVTTDAPLPTFDGGARFTLGACPSAASTCTLGETYNPKQTEVTDCDAHAMAPGTVVCLEEQDFTVTGSYATALGTTAVDVDHDLPAFPAGTVLRLGAC